MKVWVVQEESVKNHEGLTLSHISSTKEKALTWVRNQPWLKQRDDIDWGEEGRTYHEDVVIPVTIRGRSYADWRFFVEEWEVDEDW